MLTPDVLAPGTRIKLVAFSSTKAKLSSTLLGYKLNKCLIIERPTSRGISARVGDGTEWTVSFINEGNMVYFTAHVLGTSTHPMPLVFLSYPEKVEINVLRQTKRFPVFIKGNLSYKAPNPESGVQRTEIIISDISEGGCQLGSKIRCSPGEIVHLELDLPKDQHLSGLKAEVKSCNDLGGKYLMGVSFGVSATSEIYKGIQQFINELKAIPLRI